MNWDGHRSYGRVAGSGRGGVMHCLSLNALDTMNLALADYAIQLRAEAEEARANLAAPRPN